MFRTNHSIKMPHLQIIEILEMHGSHRVNLNFKISLLCLKLLQVTNTERRLNCTAGMQAIMIDV